MTEDVYVLVKFEGLERVPYNIVSIDHWNTYAQGVAERNWGSSWQEVARGTHDELKALTRLMPDPKTLNFD